jgi:hypothetical protein
MGLEEKSAQLLNVTMVTILSLVALAAAIYAFATHFAAVREIYSTLPSESQRHVVGFLSTAAILLPVPSIVISYVADQIGRWQSRKRKAVGIT